MRRLAIILTLVTVGITFGAGAAFAASWQRTTDGSLVKFNNSVGGVNNERFHVCDTSGDSYGVYAEYSYNGGSLSKHSWGGGNGTCHNFDHNWAENKVVKFRSCEEIPNWPNDCSAYTADARS